MAYNDLRDWIAALDRAGELKRIKTEADPILEIAEITDRVSKSNVGAGVSPVLGAPSLSRSSRQGGGSALLFQNIKGHPGAQVLINQFGSESRMKMALEVDSLDEIADRIRAFMDVKSPQGFLDKVKMLPMLAEMGKFFPKTVSTGAVQGSHPARQFLAQRISDPAMLAERRRPLHHSPLRRYPRSQDRQAQRRHVPHAGL